MNISNNKAGPARWGEYQDCKIVFTPVLYRDCCNLKHLWLELLHMVEQAGTELFEQQYQYGWFCLFTLNYPQGL